MKVGFCALGEQMPSSYWQKLTRFTLFNPDAASGRNHSDKTRDE